MLNVLCILLIFRASLANAACNVLYQLDDMSYCRTGHSFDVYKHYGCCCSEISPETPIDAIDRCCQVHSKCYDNLITTKTCQNSNTPYFCLYQWQCVLQQPTCNNYSKCLQSVCNCDEQFINCLAKYPYPAFAKKCQYYDGEPILKVDVDN